MNKTYRNISLIVEVRTSILYLRIGLGEIQKISGDNDFYHPVMVFLSGGLERLLKTMLCLHFEEVNNRLPNQNEIWNNPKGHDIEFLKGKVEQIVIPIDRNFGLNDYEIITADPLINRICKSLSEYGKHGRYFNLDAILGHAQEFNAQGEWENIETQVLKEFFGEDKYNKLIADPDKLDLIYETSNKILTSKLETFFRALTKQFILGNFSSKSKQFRFEIQDFINIKEEDLGKTDYNSFENHERIKR